MDESKAKKLVRVLTWTALVTAVGVAVVTALALAVDLAIATWCQRPTIVTKDLGPLAAAVAWPVAIMVALVMLFRNEKFMEVLLRKMETTESAAGMKFNMNLHRELFGSAEPASASTSAALPDTSGRSHDGPYGAALGAALALLATRAIDEEDKFFESVAVALLDNAAPALAHFGLGKSSALVRSCCAKRLPRSRGATGPVGFRHP